VFAHVCVSGNARKRHNILRQAIKNKTDFQGFKFQAVLFDTDLKHMKKTKEKRTP
jgi:hypothetical protein